MKKILLWVDPTFFFSWKKYVYSSSEIGICLTVMNFFVWTLIMILVIFQNEDNADAGNMEEDIDGDLADIETLNYDDLDSVSKLQKTQRYFEIMEVCSWNFL